MATKGCVGGETAAEGNGGRPARRWRQYLAAAVVNIAGFAIGTSFGWTAPILPLLQSKDSPLDIPPITMINASWLASVSMLTRIFAAPVFMYVNDRYGCKITGYAIAALCILSWAMMLCANSIAIVFSARVLIGIAAAGVVLLVPTFTSDFAEDDIKGQLAVIFGLSMNVGSTFSYAMGSYTSYTVYHISCLLLPIFFIATFFWLPESPLFLMAEGKHEEAKKSLMWFRNGQDCEFELDRMRVRAKEVLTKRNKKVTFSGMYDKPTIRALLITFGLITNKQLSGSTVIAVFTVTIFQETGSTISPSLSTIIIGVLLILGSLLSALAIENAGRRPLLLCSDVFTGICLAIVGAYLYLKHIGWDMEFVGWIPLVCLSLYILGMSLALGPLAFTIATEMVSAPVKGSVQTACSMYNCVIAFISTFTFASLNQSLGQHGTFWLFSAVCFIGSVCIYLLMPETKNRSAEDVVAQLRDDNYIRSVVRGSSVTLKTATNVPAC